MGLPQYCAFNGGARFGRTLTHFDQPLGQLFDTQIDYVKQLLILTRFGLALSL